MTAIATDIPPVKPLSASKLDLNRSAVARNIQLSMLFRSRIEQGVWKVGQQIPTVDQLALE